MLGWPALAVCLKSQVHNNSMQYTPSKPVGAVPAYSSLAVQRSVTLGVASSALHRAAFGLSRSVPSCRRLRRARGGLLRN